MERAVRGDTSGCSSPPLLPTFRRLRMETSIVREAGSPKKRRFFEESEASQFLLYNAHFIAMQFSRINKVGFQSGCITPPPNPPEHQVSSVASNWQRVINVLLVPESLCSRALPAETSNHFTESLLKDTEQKRSQ